MRRLNYLFDLMMELVRRDILIRYKRSVLGIFWSLLNPLLQLAVFVLVFRYIVPVTLNDFVAFLFIGILAWNWFQTSVHLGSSVIADNPNLIRQPGFPAAILPVVTVTATLVNMLLAFPVLAAMLIWMGKPITIAWLTLPLILGLQAVLTLAIIYVTARLHVSFRDTQYLLGILLLLGFYLSPIFYSPSAVPERLSAWFHLNPLVPLLTAYREVLLGGRMPSFGNLWPVGLASLTLLAISYRGFYRASHRFAEEV